MADNFITCETLRKTLNNEARCVELLETYYGPNSQFEGAHFEVFPPGEENDSDKFTAADLLACSLLNARIPANAIAEILINNPNTYNQPLSRINKTLHFMEECPATWDGKNYQGHELYQRLREINGIGETRATKLMARKRPNLFPITDSIVRKVTVGPRKKYWAPFRKWLGEDNNYNKLESIRAEAGLEDRISVIRVFDVIAWLIGSKKYKRILS